MKKTTIYLTSEEVRTGCQKWLALPGQVAPMRINLPPGFRDKQKLIVNNARFHDKRGTVATIPVCVKIRVRPVKTKKKWWKAVVAVFAVLFLIGVVEVGIESGKSKTTTSSYGDGEIRDGGDSHPEIAPEISNGSTDSGVAASGNGQSASESVYTDIPRVLLQGGWNEIKGTSEYCPRIEFYEDGQFKMWVNLGYDYCEATSTYTVYVYDGGPRMIACNTGFLHVDYPLLADSFYLVESGDGVWSYEGEAIGFTDSSCGFQKAEQATFSVSAKHVEVPDFSKYGREWGTEGYADDLTIHWIDGGQVCFSFGVYRMFGYENQVAVCLPGKHAYCFLRGDTGEPVGLIELSFLDEAVALTFLSANERSGYVRGYVGQTILYDEVFGIVS